MRDVQSGETLAEFMKRYNDSSIDVLSLAQLRHMIKQPSNGFDASQLANINAVLDHVSEQMSHVSNDRRSQLTLGEFLARHHYLSGSSLRRYSSDVLKSQIERVIGGISSQDHAAAAIDW